MAAGRAALAGFGDVTPLLVENAKKYIPDDNERKAFGERALKEFKSGNYRFSFMMYDDHPL
jgi:hypothetical protein